MATRNTKMALSAFLYPTGYHVAAWRHPDVPANAGVNFEYYSDIAQTAERGKFDFLFLPDSAGMRGTDMEALCRTAVRYVSQLEPLTLLAALSVVTQRIGLTATISSSYIEPYHAARALASLDHLSRGRAGWNLVTSQNPEEAYNFGRRATPDHDERYVRASEFADVVKGLWDTWEDDAFLGDKTSGLFFRPEGVRPLNHDGPAFRVRGPMNMSRSPQGQPVTLQAGSSDAGKDLAARTAEVVFTAQPSIEPARAFYADLKARLSGYGRPDRDLCVMPGVCPVVARTRQEAEDKFEQLQALIDPTVGLGMLQSELGHVDLSECDLDGPLPPLPASNAGKARQQLLVAMAEREQLTIRQLYRRVAGSRGHHQIIGTPSDVADGMQEWFEGGAADGFMIMGLSLPGGLHDFVELVVPELQRRGLFRTEYEGHTLREHLGFSRPSGRRTLRAVNPRTNVAAAAEHPGHP